MFTVALPRIGTWEVWRDAARRLAGAGVPPDQILWDYDGEIGALFAGSDPLPEATRPVKAPQAFVDLAQVAVWHSDPQRFARLYDMLWRLRYERGLMQDRADEGLAKLRQMEKSVNRCKHKMKAFVRFRDLRQGGERRSFAAWFEPTHHTVEPTAPFFARRFADMDWMIATPDVTAEFVEGKLSFHPGQAKPDLPEDATEDLWGTYFCNIFNPARLKVKAMTSEMPKKYWKNMPEARHIPELIAGAEAKVQKMREAAPSVAPAKVATIRRQMAKAAQPASWNMLDAGLSACTRCPLHGPATQVVPGEGPRDARLMIVGEQPGDMEDEAGRPFVGPAGQLFDRLAEEAGLKREEAFLTNAVKHFKYEQRGKRRIHQNPNTSEIQHCRFWLEQEVALVKPKLILAMGGSAAESLTGSRAGLLSRRGQVEETGHGPVLLTVHPSYLLRLPEHLKAQAQAEFRADLEKAVALTAA